jgi:hypothetical protein
MPIRPGPLWLPAALAVIAACGDGATPPDDEPLRTVLVHRQDTGANVLLNTDGSEAGTYDPGAGLLVAIGASANGQALVLLHGEALVVGSVAHTRLDTVLPEIPGRMSLAALSDDERLVAVVSYAPTPGVIVYDRANRRGDTLSYGDIDPVLPPVISPDGTRIALLGLTPLSITVTIVEPADPTRRTSGSLSTSRFRNQLIFGWPRWIDDGILLAVVRGTDQVPDTLVVGLIEPDRLDADLVERYRAVLAPAGGEEVAFRAASTYALSDDGQALALGAAPAGDPGRHAVYLVTPATEQVRLIRDDPQEFLTSPLFIRR